MRPTQTHMLKQKTSFRTLVTSVLTILRVDVFYLFTAIYPKTKQIPVG